MKKYILGIDTSAYTTSCAVADYNGNVIENYKKNLDVQNGQNGLRQQEAVFMHLKNLPELLEKINTNFEEIGIVSVSNRPRNVDGSYMPVFTVGQNYGRVIAKAIKAQYVEYSHQENHIAAGLLNCYKAIYRDILAIHISGGTTELLLTQKCEKGFKTTLVGGTKDITFGQLIDRIGVYYGFNFPCGSHMQKCLDNAKEKIQKIKAPRIVGESFINLSGVENYYKRIIDSGKYSMESVINSLFEYISNCLKYIINNTLTNNTINAIVITGGVSSNSYLRNTLQGDFNKIQIIFPERTLSTDNSAGNCVLPIMDRWYNETKAN